MDNLSLCHELIEDLSRAFVFTGTDSTFFALSRVLHLFWGKTLENGNRKGGRPQYEAWQTRVSQGYILTCVFNDRHLVTTGGYIIYRMTSISGRRSCMYVCHIFTETVPKSIRSGFRFAELEISESLSTWTLSILASDQSIQEVILARLIPTFHFTPVKEIFWLSKGIVPHQSL
jgi:hypothetical protein